MTKPYFTDTVTQIPADWANAVSSLVYDVFELSTTKSGAMARLGLGTMAAQQANMVQIVGGSINNCPIGIDVPMQGRFSVLSVDVDPVSPEHAVNKRYLDRRFAASLNTYVAIAGSAMTGPLELSGDPNSDLEAVPRRWVDQRLVDTIQARPLQRWSTESVGGATFEWLQFVRPPVVFYDNFVVFLNGVYQVPEVDYVVDVDGYRPVFEFPANVSIGAKFDVIYFNNTQNLLSIPSATNVPSGFSAQPGWSDPINMRVNYSTTNAGENLISISHTILREMFFGVVVTSGVLGDQQASWSTQWLPGSPAASLHPPELSLVSGTEAKLSLPEASFDHYWEGRMEITLLIDNVPMPNKLWMDMSNQVTPGYKDGRVRWGVIFTTTYTSPLIDSITVDVPTTLPEPQGQAEVQ